MSHNVLTLNAQGASRSGGVVQALNDLSDLSLSSPSNGQVIQYQSGSWVKGTAAPNAVASVSGIDTDTGYFTASYYDPAYNAADGFYINFRSAFGDPASLLELTNDDTYASHIISFFAINSQYWRGFSLVAGHKYRLRADVCIPSNSDTGAYVEAQWQTSGGTALGPIGFIRRPSENMSRLDGVIDLTGGSDTDVGLKYISKSGNVAFIQAGVDNRQISITARIIE